MSCIINKWVGRFGNNLLQLVRCIYYAKNNNYKIICFPNHKLFKYNKIELENTNDIDSYIDFYNEFFDLSKFYLKDPEPYQMKEITLKYIKPILIIKYHIENLFSNNIFIHIRGGDIFSKNPHPAYVQPPLNYYENIINNYNFTNINIVHEDNLNPCVNLLKQNSSYNFYSQDLEKDLELLINAENLVFGFGTFGFVIYLLNDKIKKIFFPDYVINELPNGSWGDVELNIINLPNYIKVGEWKNTLEQINLIVNYKL